MADKSKTVGFPVGTRIGKYEVRERLGMGGQAIVYKCHDPMLDRHVAIKQISSHLAEDPKFVEQFRREAQILARLGAEQPGIVTIHELVEDQRGLFIVMEFVPGRSLETLIRDKPGPFEPKATLQIIWRLAGALNAVHNAGIIHRDIKPGNIIIGESLRAKITDFGVAASITGQTSMPLGTTKYMAPELFEGAKVDGRADMYSLGFITYEMLVGRQKFNEVFADVVRDPQSEVLRWMKWHGNRSVTAPMAHEVNPTVPETLGRIVAKMMAKDPDNRYAGMEELGRAIRAEFSPRARVLQAAGVSVGAGLEAEDLQIQMPEGTRPGAPGALVLEAAPLEEEEGPATAPIPKKKLSRKAKLILAGSAAGVVMITGVVLLVMMELRKGRAAAERTNILKRAGDAYKAALPPQNAKAKFEEALRGFDDLQKRFGGSKEEAMSSVMIHMCRAYLAVEAEDWDRSDAERQLAEARRDQVQRKWDGSQAWPAEELKKWVEEKKAELEACKDYRADSRRFVEWLSLADRLTGAIDKPTGAIRLLDNALGPAEAGKVADAIKLLQEAEQVVTAIPKESDREYRSKLDGAANVISAAQKELRRLIESTNRQEIRKVITDAKGKVVTLAGEMPALIESSVRTVQQEAAVAQYIGRVRSAGDAVTSERVRRMRDQWKQELGRLRDACENDLSRARELAGQGKIKEAENALDDAAKSRKALKDLQVPKDLVSLDQDITDLTKLRDGTAADLGAKIGDTTTSIDVARSNLKKIVEAKEFIAKADKAREEGDKEQELKHLLAAVRVNPEIASQLQEPINKLKSEIATEKANMAKRVELIEQAKEDMAAQKWEDALRKLEEAQSYKAEQGAADDIAKCQYQVTLAKAEQLIEAAQYDDAIGVLQGLREARPDAAEMIDAKIQQVETRKAFDNFMAVGDVAMKRKEWPKARQQYTEALKIYFEGPLRARAQKSHSKAMFEEWLSKGQALLAEGDYRAALAYFLNAKKHATSEVDAKRVDELIETCNKVLQPSQGSG